MIGKTNNISTRITTHDRVNQTDRYYIACSVSVHDTSDSFPVNNYRWRSRIYTPFKPRET